MQRIFDKLKDLTINDILKIEQSDFQYIALKELFLNIKNKDIYLPLILANSIICYQLSSTGEKYWTEFSENSILFFKENSTLEDINLFFKEFLPSSKGNKRFIQTKLNRLDKLKFFLDIFYNNQLFYYENMVILQQELAKTMNQKKDDKTIVFGVKMFSYGARNTFNKLILFPSKISIPIDSRLTNIFELYKDNFDGNISEFYKKLSEKLNIPPLHLDACIWVNYEKLIEK